MAFAKAKQGAVGVSNDIGTAPIFKEYTAFSSIDLMPDSPAGISYPRGFIISNVGAGTKVLGYIDATGNVRTLDATNLQGVYMPGCVRAFTAATTCTAIVVFF